MYTQKKLSIIVTARNDNHGGALLERINMFLSGIFNQSEKFRINVEIILVEWNPPEDEKTLIDALSWPKGHKYCHVKIIIIPNSGRPDCMDAWININLLWNALSGGTPAMASPASRTSNAILGFTYIIPPSFLVLLVLVLYSTVPNPIKRNAVIMDSLIAWKRPAVIPNAVPSPKPIPI